MSSAAAPASAPAPAPCKECGAQGCVPKDSFYIGVATGNGPFCTIDCLSKYRDRVYPRPPTPPYIHRQRVDGGGARAF